jgi:D-tagatose-1,6-bisphosphate aldolase subunit GatZ/KbaZ
MHIPEPATAYRAAHLASVAETVSTRAATTLHYVIGTEVPVPGGAADEIGQLEVTRPEALLATIEEHRRAFAAAGVGEAFERVMAVVVRPGVEFDDRKVVVYQPDKATELSAALTRLPGMVFEAHSTDYQPPDSLSRLVRDGFAILKVGPRLTFELREALYSLDEIATALDSTWAERSLRSEMERQMVVDPGYWQSYYRGGPNQQRILRHFSYSDRIRYYWSTAASQEAINRLFGLLNGTKIPEPLVSQFLPKLYDRVASGILRPTPRALVLEAVTDVLRIYGNATRPTLETS